MNEEPNVALAQLHLSSLLAQAEKVFRPESGMKLTLIARSPTFVGQWMVLTRDDIPAVIDLLTKYQEGLPLK